MTKLRMAEMLIQTKEALSDAGLLSGKIDPNGELVIDEGSKNLIGQLILASAIEGRPK